MGNLISMGFDKSIQPKEFRLINIMNNEHCIVWPETWSDLLRHISSLAPQIIKDPNHIKYIEFITSLQGKRVYDELSFQALVPVIQTKPGGITIYTVFLFNICYHDPKESCKHDIFLSHHLHLKPMSLTMIDQLINDTLPDDDTSP